MTTKIEIRSVFRKLLFEFETKRDTQDFKQIRAVFESYKSYLNVLNS